MAMIASGIFALGASFVAADAQRKQQAKLLELQKQQTYAKAKGGHTYLEMAVVAAVAFGVVYVVVKYVRGG